MHHGMSYAKEEIFGRADIIGHLKNCWTVGNYCITKTTVALAAQGHMDIKPVMVRAPINMNAYRKYLRAELRAKLLVSEMEWPADMDPTAKVSLPIDDSLDEQSDMQLMIQMLGSNSASMKRLKVHLSLLIESDDSWPYYYTNSFLDALVQCTGIESLTITQQDYAYQKARMKVVPYSVQIKVLGYIENMRNLLCLDWYGNTYENNWNWNEGVFLHRKTICSFFPSTLRELTVRDGSEPRMDRWFDIFLSYDFELLMSNHNAMFPSLNAIYMPSSFWSLSKDKFNPFLDAINEGHFQRIGFSDEFKLYETPYMSIYPRTKLSSPRVIIRYLITWIRRDIIIYLRGATNLNEREIRVRWTSTLPYECEETEGAQYKTITLYKNTLHQNITIEVLI